MTTEPENSSKVRSSKVARFSPARWSPQVRLLSAGLVGLLAVYAGALLMLRPPAPGREITLDALVREAGARHVSAARFLDEDARVTASVTQSQGSPATKVWASYPRSDAATNDLLKSLLTSGAQVQVEPQTTKAMVRFLAQFLLPLLILANLFALLFFVARPGGAGGTDEYRAFGRLGNKRVGAGERPPTTFADVAGAGPAVTELAEIRDYLADPERFKHMGASPPKGVLLVGPPGCGKTLLARAVAGEAKAAFFSISGSEFVESLVGIGAARVRDLFAQAAAATPAIIFIDELDGAGRQRGTGLGGGHDEREQTLNELLVQMDGFSSTSGLVVIGATNRPDILDPALLRAGRFDRRVVVEPPDLEQRLAILRLHASGRRIADPEADLPVVARRTPGFTGADLANVLNEAALLAVRWDDDAIERAHLEEAVERVISGPRRGAHIIPPNEKRHIAYHEAGHAVVAAALGRQGELDKVSVTARGASIGHFSVLNEHKTVFTRRDMEAEIAVAMAGLAAEEIVLGEPSTGAESDLERANRTAKDMVGRFGMSARMGRLQALRPHGEVFLGRDYLLNAEVSQPTLEHLDEEVRRMLDEQERAARSILEFNRNELDHLAQLLQRDETVQGPPLEDILRQVTAPGHNGARGRPDGAGLTASASGPRAGADSDAGERAGDR